MSLRLIARDLYRLQQQVDQLEKRLSEAPPAKREALKRKLSRTKFERHQIKGMLDGHLDR